MPGSGLPKMAVKHMPMKKEMYIDILINDKWSPQVNEYDNANGLGITNLLAVYHNRRPEGFFCEKLYTNDMFTGASSFFKNGQYVLPENPIPEEDKITFEEYRRSVVDCVNREGSMLKYLSKHVAYFPAFNQPVLTGGMACLMPGIYVQCNCCGAMAYVPGTASDAVNKQYAREVIACLADEEKDMSYLPEEIQEVAGTARMLMTQAELFCFNCGTHLAVYSAIYSRDVAILKAITTGIISGHGSAIEALKTCLQLQGAPPESLHLKQSEEMYNQINNEKLKRYLVRARTQYINCVYAVEHGTEVESGEFCVNQSITTETISPLEASELSIMSSTIGVLGGVVNLHCGSLIGYHGFDGLCNVMATGSWFQGLGLTNLNVQPMDDAMELVVFDSDYILSRPDTPFVMIVPKLSMIESLVDDVLITDHSVFVKVTGSDKPRVMSKDLCHKLNTSATITINGTRYFITTIKSDALMEAVLIVPAENATLKFTRVITFQKNIRVKLPSLNFDGITSTFNIFGDKWEYYDISKDLVKRLILNGLNGKRSIEEMLNYTAGVVSTKYVVGGKITDLTGIALQPFVPELTAALLILNDSRRAMRWASLMHLTNFNVKDLKAKMWDTVVGIVGRAVQKLFPDVYDRFTAVVNEKVSLHVMCDQQHLVTNLSEAIFDLDDYKIITTHTTYTHKMDVPGALCGHHANCHYHEESAEGNHCLCCNRACDKKYCECCAISQSCTHMCHHSCSGSTIAHNCGKNCLCEKHICQCCGVKGCGRICNLCVAQEAETIEKVYQPKKPVKLASTPVTAESAQKVVPVVVRKPELRRKQITKFVECAGLDQTHHSIISSTSLKTADQLLIPAVDRSHCYIPYNCVKGIRIIPTERVDPEDVINPNNVGSHCGVVLYKTYYPDLTIPENLMDQKTHHIDELIEIAQVNSLNVVLTGDRGMSSVVRYGGITDPYYHFVLTNVMDGYVPQFHWVACKPPKLSGWPHGVWMNTELPHSTDMDLLGKNSFLNEPVELNYNFSKHAQSVAVEAISIDQQNAIKTDQTEIGELRVVNEAGFTFLLNNDCKKHEPARGLLCVPLVGLMKDIVEPLFLAGGDSVDVRLQVVNLQVRDLQSMVEQYPEFVKYTAVHFLVSKHSMSANPNYGVEFKSSPVSCMAEIPSSMKLKPGDCIAGFDGLGVAKLLTVHHHGGRLVVKGVDHTIVSYRTFKFSIGSLARELVAAIQGYNHLKNLDSITVVDNVLGPAGSGKSYTIKHKYNGPESCVVCKIRDPLTSYNGMNFGDVMSLEKYSLSTMQFDTVVVDESTMLSAFDLAKLAKRPNMKLAMFGDRLQIGVVDMTNVPGSRDICSICDLFPSAKLNHTYRVGNPLAKEVLSLVYNGLESRATHATTYEVVRFDDVLHVAEYAKEFNFDCIYVFMNNDYNALTDFLTDKGWLSDVAVRKVHANQGSEADKVIVYYGSFKRGAYSITNQQRYLVTAITRAKHHLVWGTSSDGCDPASLLKASMSGAGSMMSSRMVPTAIENTPLLDLNDLKLNRRPTTAEYAVIRTIVNNDDRCKEYGIQLVDVDSPDCLTFECNALTRGSRLSIGFDGLRLPLSMRFLRNHVKKLIGNLLRYGTLPDDNGIVLRVSEGQLYIQEGSACGEITLADVLNCVHNSIEMEELCGLRFKKLLSQEECNLVNGLLCHNDDTSFVQLERRGTVMRVYIQFNKKIHSADVPINTVTSFNSLSDADNLSVQLRLRHTLKEACVFKTESNTTKANSLLVNLKKMCRFDGTFDDTTMELLNNKYRKLEYNNAVGFTGSVLKPRFDVSNGQVEVNLTVNFTFNQLSCVIDLVHALHCLDDLANHVWLTLGDGSTWKLRPFQGCAPTAGIIFTNTRNNDKVVMSSSHTMYASGDFLSCFVHSAQRSLSGNRNNVALIYNYLTSLRKPGGGIFDVLRHFTARARSIVASAYRASCAADENKCFSDGKMIENLSTMWYEDNKKTLECWFPTTAKYAPIYAWEKMRIGCVAEDGGVRVMPANVVCRTLNEVYECMNNKIGTAIDFNVNVQNRLLMDKIVAAKYKVNHKFESRVSLNGRVVENFQSYINTFLNMNNIDVVEKPTFNTTFARVSDAVGLRFVHTALRIREADVVGVDLETLIDNRLAGMRLDVARLSVCERIVYKNWKDNTMECLSEKLKTANAADKSLLETQMKALSNDANYIRSHKTHDVLILGCAGNFEESLVAQYKLVIVLGSLVGAPGVKVDGDCKVYLGDGGFTTPITKQRQVLVGRVGLTSINVVTDAYCGFKNFVGPNVLKNTTEYECKQSGFGPYRVSTKLVTKAIARCFADENTSISDLMEYLRSVALTNIYTSSGVVSKFSEINHEELNHVAIIAYNLAGRARAFYNMVDKTKELDAKQQMGELGKILLSTVFTQGVSFFTNRNLEDVVDTVKTMLDAGLPGPLKAMKDALKLISVTPKHHCFQVYLNNTGLLGKLTSGTTADDDEPTVPAPYMDDDKPLVEEPFLVEFGEGTTPAEMLPIQGTCEDAVGRAVSPVSDFEDGNLSYNVAKHLVSKVVARSNEEPELVDEATAQQYETGVLNEPLPNPDEDDGNASLSPDEGRVKMSVENGTPCNEVVTTVRKPQTALKPTAVMVFAGSMGDNVPMWAILNVVHQHYSVTALTPSDAATAEMRSRCVRVLEYTDTYSKFTDLGVGYSKLSLMEEIRDILKNLQQIDIRSIMFDVAIGLSFDMVKNFVKARRYFNIIPMMTKAIFANGAATLEGAKLVNSRPWDVRSWSDKAEDLYCIPIEFSDEDCPTYISNDLRFFDPERVVGFPLRDEEFVMDVQNYAVYQWMLSIGVKVVLFTMGSIKCRNYKDMLQRTVEKHGTPIVVVTGAMSSESCPFAVGGKMYNTNCQTRDDKVMVVSHLKYKLFRKMIRVAVHHGGMGTCVTFCDEEIEQHIIPQAFDQFFNQTKFDHDYQNHLPNVDLARNYTAFPNNICRLMGIPAEQAPHTNIAYLRLGNNQVTLCAAVVNKKVRMSDVLVRRAMWISNDATGDCVLVSIAAQVRNLPHLSECAKSRILQDCGDQTFNRVEDVVTFFMDNGLNALVVLDANFNCPLASESRGISLWCNVAQDRPIRVAINADATHCQSFTYESCEDMEPLVSTQNIAWSMCWPLHDQKERLDSLQHVIDSWTENKAVKHVAAATKHALDDCTGRIGKIKFRNVDYFRIIKSAAVEGGLIVENTKLSAGRMYLLFTNVGVVPSMCVSHLITGQQALMHGRAEGVCVVALSAGPKLIDWIVTNNTLRLLTNDCVVALNMVTKLVCVNRNIAVNATGVKNSRRLYINSCFNRKHHLDQERAVVKSAKEIVLVGEKTLHRLDSFERTALTSDAFPRVGVIGGKLCMLLEVPNNANTIYMLNPFHSLTKKFAQTNTFYYEFPSSKEDVQLALHQLRKMFSRVNQNGVPNDNLNPNEEVDCTAYNASTPRVPVEIKDGDEFSYEALMTNFERRLEDSKDTIAEHCQKQWGSGLENVVFKFVEGYRLKLPDAYQAFMRSVSLRGNLLTVATGMLTFKLIVSGGRNQMWVDSSDLQWYEPATGGTKRQLTASSSEVASVVKNFEVCGEPLANSISVDKAVFECSKAPVFVEFYQDNTAECSVQVCSIDVITDMKTMDYWQSTVAFKEPTVHLPTDQGFKVTSRLSCDRVTKSTKITMEQYPVVARPSLTRMVYEELNSMTTRQGAAKNFQSCGLDEKFEFELFQSNYFKKDVGNYFAKFADDTINFNFEDTLQWVLDHNYPDYVYTSLKYALEKSFELEPINKFYVHGKVEQTTKLDKVGRWFEEVVTRSIVAGSYAVSALFGPVFIKLKTRFKECLNDKVFYVDGMTPLQVAKLLESCANVHWFVEDDLTKQDAQTTKDQIDLEFVIYEKLGLDPSVLGLYRLCHSNWQWKGYKIKGICDNMRLTGQVTTAIGNAITNLTVHNRLYHRNKAVIKMMLVLGDDNLLLCSSPIDVKNHGTETKAFYNMISKVTQRQHVGNFISYLVHSVDGKLSLCPHFNRMRHRFSVCNYTFLEMERKEKIDARALSYCTMLGNIREVTDIALSICPSYQVLDWYNVHSALLANALYEGNDEWMQRQVLGKLIHMLRRRETIPYQFTHFVCD